MAISADAKYFVVLLPVILNADNKLGTHIECDVLRTTAWAIGDKQRHNGTMPSRTEHSHRDARQNTRNVR
jgi:hypothetical protein